jgi:hypothetical protein
MLLASEHMLDVSADFDRRVLALAVRSGSERRGFRR